MRRLLFPPLGRCLSGNEVGGVVAGSAGIRGNSCAAEREPHCVPRVRREVGSMGKSRSMVATLPRPAHPEMDHFASDAPDGHARRTHGARAITMMRQLNAGADSALRRVAVRK